MGRFFVALLASLFVCYMAATLAPKVFTHVVFHINTFGVTACMCLFAVMLVFCFKIAD